MEYILNVHNVDAEVYHGGYFNGVACHKIIDNIKEIMQEKGVEKSKEETKQYFWQENTNKTWKMRVLAEDGVNFTLLQLMIVEPTHAEVNEFKNRKTKIKNYGDK